MLLCSSYEKRTGNTNLPTTTTLGPTQAACTALVQLEEEEELMVGSAVADTLPAPSPQPYVASPCTAGPYVGGINGNLTAGDCNASRASSYRYQHNPYTSGEVRGRTARGP